MCHTPHSTHTRTKSIAVASSFSSFSPPAASAAMGSLFLFTYENIVCKLNLAHANANSGQCVGAPLPRQCVGIRIVQFPHHLLRCRHRWPPSICAIACTLFSNDFRFFIFIFLHSILDFSNRILINRNAVLECMNKLIYFSRTLDNLTVFLFSTDTEDSSCVQMENVCYSAVHSGR